MGPSHLGRRMSATVAVSSMKAVVGVFMQQQSDECSIPKEAPTRPGYPGQDEPWICGGYIMLHDICRLRLGSWVQ